MPSFLYQVDKAVERNDLISINHRTTELLASYFDIIFALNEKLHPGEKRLLDHTKDLSILPKDYEDNIIKKGKYTLEFVRHGPGQVFYLKIKKGKKTICLISGGERVKYKNQGSLSKLMSDPDIPDDCKLKIKRKPALKIAYIIFETGKKALVCPFYKIRFKVEYE